MVLLPPQSTQTLGTENICAHIRVFNMTVHSNKAEDQAKTNRYNSICFKPSGGKRPDILSLSPRGFCAASNALKHFLESC